MMKRKLDAEENAVPKIKEQKKSEIDSIVKNENQIHIKKKASALEKPNWKQLKKEKKELKISRKKQCTFYEIANESKKVWEQMRPKSVTKGEKEQLANELNLMIKDNLHNIIFAHDMARIIQWILKVGTNDVRENLISQLIPHVLEMLRSKYSVFSVKKMLKYGSPESTAKIVQAMMGNIVKLMSSSIAVSAVEYAYKKSNSTTKNLIIQELYGDIYKNTKDNKIKCLNDIFQITPTMKEATISTTKLNILRVIKKKPRRSEIINSVILDFMSCCSQADREEIISNLHDHVLDLLTTEKGVKVGMMCVWYGTNKDKKMIVKSLRNSVVQIATSEKRYLFLLALFDSIDDIVVLSKVVIEELLSNAIPLYQNAYGKRVLLYLVAPRNSLYFNSNEIEILMKGDDIPNRKKDAETRRKQILSCVSNRLLNSIILNTKDWLSNGSVCLLTLEILKTGSGPELQNCLNAIAKFILNKSNTLSVKDKEILYIEHSGIHLLIKKLLQHEKITKKESETCISYIIAENIDSEMFQWLATFNRGCFLLILIFESDNVEAVDLIKSKFPSKEVLKLLKKQKFVGAKILLSKLEL